MRRAPEGFGPALDVGQISRRTLKQTGVVLSSSNQKSITRRLMLNGMNKYSQQREHIFNRQACCAAPRSACRGHPCAPFLQADPTWFQQLGSHGNRCRSTTPHPPPASAPSLPGPGRIPPFPDSPIHQHQGGSFSTLLY